MFFSCQIFNENTQALTKNMTSVSTTCLLLKIIVKGNRMHVPEHLTASNCKLKIDFRYGCSNS